jgi:lipoyl(octanoyl) transferase
MPSARKMKYQTATWRLLKTPPSAGAWNMAVDEAILEAAGSGNARPTLRLYAWEPACLSLGYAQPAGDIDRLRLAQVGWDIVRRPTGGKAILHTDELTYSVIGPPAEPRLSGSVIESYRRLSEALLVALQELGLPAAAQPEKQLMQDRASEGPVCFEVPSNYEIVVNGKKLVGSAQARRKAGVLQHGSLPLYGDLARITRVLVFEDETDRQGAAARVLQRATTVETVLGKQPSWQEAAQAFQHAFSEVLELVLEEDELSPAEVSRAKQLVDEKYSSDIWTYRV